MRKLSIVAFSICSALIISTVVILTTPIPVLAFGCTTVNCGGGVTRTCCGVSSSGTDYEGCTGIDANGTAKGKRCNDKKGSTPAEVEEDESDF
jgi:hypothetical protein